MTPSQKPEWIEIADADNAASVRRISKGLPIMALVAVAAILGVGVVVAQTQEQAPAYAVESVVPSVQSAQASSPVASAPSATTKSAAAFVVASTKEPAAPKATLNSPTMKNPSIGALPTGGGDDDDDEDEGRDHNKGGEHDSDDDEGDDDEGDDDHKKGGDHE